MLPSLARGDVDWLPWCAEAFRRARAEQKPILLSIVAEWARGCGEMDRVCYADRSVASLVRDRVIAVRVDADARPDIADRYDLGGLPTTALLTPDGRLLGGGTFVSAPRLVAALQRVTCAEALAPGECPVASDAAGVSCATAATLESAALVDAVFGSFDEAHAGFGAAPKFPLAAPVRLAIDLHLEQPSPRLLECATRTLDAMGWGPLYDELDGGFFRCAAAADWTGVQTEKLLSTNAAMLDLYLYAGRQLAQPRWLGRAEDLVEYIERAFGEKGGWRVSACSAAGRRFTDSAALTVSALLRAAEAFQSDGLGTRALAALEEALLASYKPGGGVAHAADGVRGLLVDQVAMASANLDAWEATGNVVYRMMAEELMHYALRTMWQPGGGFCDRAVDLRSDEPATDCRPFVINCDAAIALRRLADATGDELFARRSKETVQSLGARAAEAGPLAAHYLIAGRAVLR